MAEDRDPDEGKGTPSLEPPSLFGRKKKERKPRPASPPPPAPFEPEAAVEPEPAPVEVPDPPDEPTTIFDEPVAVPASATSPLSPPPAPTPREPRPPREPWLLGRPAAALTGLLVGALIVAGAAGSQRICDAVRGTSSCGNSGFLLLVAVLVVAVLAGATLLRAAHVPQPGSTSFLAVGLLSVVTLLFLVGQLFEWWMIIVIPLVSVGTFLLSHWVTTTYIEPEDDVRPSEPSEERGGVR